MPKNLVIFDLEATCEETKSEKFLSEIIEIGAIKVDLELLPSKEFQTFVRPYNLPLSEFCKGLTGIKDEQLYNAPSFPLAFGAFFYFCNSSCWFDFVLASWGDSDANRLVRDCK